jgi:hypothetical protein
MSEKDREEYYGDKKSLPHLEYHYYHGTFRNKTHDISHLLIGESKVDRKRKAMTQLYENYITSLSGIRGYSYSDGEDIERLTVVPDGLYNRREYRSLLLSIPDSKELRVTTIVRLLWRIFVMIWILLSIPPPLWDYFNIGYKVAGAVLVDQWFLSIMISLVQVGKRFCHPFHGSLLGKGQRMKSSYFNKR